MSFWDTITKAVSSIPVPSITPAKKEPVLEARIGEGMTPEQTAKANEIVRNPDTAMNEAKSNSFWGKVKNEFTPQDVEIRNLFGIESNTVKTAPIIKQVLDLDFRLLEAIPRALGTLGGELKGKGEATGVNLGIDARRLGFDTPEYQTASKEQTDAINNGENPWISGLRIMSNKTLDIAFGASLVSDLSKLSTKLLLGGGAESKVEAQNIVDAYKINSKEAFARLKNAPLAEREKAMADLVNMKNQAEKVLREVGKPTALDRAKITASRYLDVLSRETPVTKNFWADFSKSNMELKPSTIKSPVLNVPQLGGTREVPNQTPAMGLSLKKVENVGTNNLNLPQDLAPLAEKAVSMSEENFVGLFEKALKSQNLTIKDSATNALSSMRNEGFSTPNDFYKSVTEPKQKSIFENPTKTQTPVQEEAFNQLKKMSSKIDSIAKLEEAINKNQIDGLEDVVQFHGSQNKDIAGAFKNGTLRVSEDGLIGKGFYVTGTPELADYFGKQIKNGDHRINNGVKPDIYAIDLRELNIKKLPYGKGEYYDFLDKENMTTEEYNQKLKDEGYDGLNLEGRGETVIFDPKKVKIMDLNKLIKPVKKQSELVKEAISTTPKSIKQIAKETKVLEPNVRRILGVGAKEGTFERIDKGIYVLSKDGEDMAWIETGDAMESLSRLAKEGMKADMVFLDIPYDTPAIKGGSRGMNYNLISVADFGKVLDSVKVIARKENSPVIHMYSQAPSGMTAMQKYNDLFLEKGFKPVGRGELQKTFKDGSPVTNVRGVVSKPEGILVFSKSGELDKELKNLNFKLVRPKGYQSEKPAEMLKQMIEMTTEEGDVVLDPFAGSGVTGAEAIKAGRKVHLIEKDQSVVDNFIKPRIKEAISEKPKVEVPKVPENKNIISNIDSNFSIGGDEYTGKKIIIDGNHVGDVSIADGELSGIKINPKYRKQGIGTRVISEIFNNTDKLYIRSIPKAVKFYEKIGVKDFQYNKEAGLYEGYLYKKDFVSKPQEVIKTPSEEVADKYYNEVLKPKMEKGESLVIGADDLKYHFGKDFNPENHSMYSKATNELYERLIKEVKNPMVHFSVGGTGSGKSDFIIKDLSENFDGIIYDSTGWNYEGITKQIQFAYDNGKSVELYGIIPDIQKARAYTFKREAEGNHPVSEDSFIRTHVGAVDTMIKLIDDGADVYTLDTRGKTKQEILQHDYKLNQIDTLKGLGYNEEYVKEQTQKVTGSNYQEIISGGKESSQGISRENWSAEQITPDNIPERVSTIDRLISENKIRVVSRNNRDVYQYKRGQEWVNARDEDSAIKQVTQPKIKKVQVLPKELEDGKTYLSIVKETLDLNPAKQLEKYYDPKFGGLPEVGTVKSVSQGGRANVSKWRRDGDQIASELGYEDSETAREEFDRYLQNKKEYNADLKAYIKNRNDYLAQEKIKPTSSVVEKEVPIIETKTGEGRSLEIQGEQFLNKIDEPFRDKVSSLPEIIEQTQTSVKDKINLLDYIRTPDRVLQKIGFAKEAGMLRRGYESYLKELPKNIQKITDWSKRVSSEGNINIFKWLDGEPVTLLPEDQKVADEIKDWLKEWATRLNLPEDNQISHYITHIFDKELLSKEFDEDLAKIIADKIPKQVYDPFLLSRLGAKGYKQDTWKALDAYVKRATRKVHMDPALEAVRAKAGSSLDMSNIEASQFKYLQSYINGINMRPTWYDDMLDNTVKSIFGYQFGQRPVTYLTKVLRQMTFRGMLGLNIGSAMRNISQGINTYALLGNKYTAIGYMKLFNSNSYKELEREGVLNIGFIQDRGLSSTKKALEKIDKALFVFFDTAEKINRGSAYFGAKALAYSRGMNEEQAIEFAKKVVRDTQFSFGSIDTPVALQSDIVKTLSQFQTFTIKQIEFLTEMAKDKNWWGLIRYAVAGLAFVYTIGKAFGMKPEELIPSFRFGTPPSLKVPVEVTKAVMNTPDKYNQPRSWSQKLNDIGTAMIGLIPAGSQIKKTLQGINTVNEGGSFDKGGKLQFPQGQSLPEKTQSVLFGKYASDEAQNYFNKSEINSEEMKKIKPIYDQVQSLANADKKDEALALVNGLTDDEYALYKKYKTVETAKKTIQGKKDILPKFLEIQKVNKTNSAQAQEMLNALTDDEYKYYTLVKKQIQKDQTASQGEVPTYSNDEPQTEQSILGTVTTYAKAIGTDPLTAFNRIFTGQRIRRVDNGAVIVERMTLKASEGVKTARGATSEMKLDHTIPLELGGSNNEDNLKLVDSSIWESYTPVENYLGKKLRDDELNKSEVQDLITRFKNGEITAEDVYNYK